MIIIDLDNDDLTGEESDFISIKSIGIKNGEFVLEKKLLIDTINGILENSYIRIPPNTKEVDCKEFIKEIIDKAKKFDEQLNKFVCQMESIHGVEIIISQDSRFNQKFKIGCKIDINKVNPVVEKK